MASACERWVEDQSWPPPRRVSHAQASDHSEAATYRSREDRRPLRIRKRWLVGAVMPYLAALAPPGWDVRLLDDEIEEPDYNAPVDVVSDMFPQLRVPETTPLRSTVMRSQSRWISSRRCDM